MTKAIAIEPTEVLTAEQAARIDGHKKKILAFDQSMESSWRGFAVYSYLCGRELLALKAALPHGNSDDASKGLMDYVKANFTTFSYSTATNRMRLAETLESKFASVANFKKSLALLDKNPERESAAKVITKAVHDVLDGKTVTAFLREENKIRQPEKQKHTPSKLTPEELVQAEQEQAEALFDAAIDAMRTVIEGDYHLRVSPARRENGLGVGIKWNDALRAIKAGKKKGLTAEARRRGGAKGTTDRLKPGLHTHTTTKEGA